MAKMTKWDTIQEDVKDMYVHLDEVVEDDDNDDDFFGFSKTIEVDHLTDEQVANILEMFGDK